MNKHKWYYDASMYVYRTETQSMEWNESNINHAKRLPQPVLLSQGYDVYIRQYLVLKAYQKNQCYIFTRMRLYE